MYFNPSVMGYPNSLPPQMWSDKDKYADDLKWGKDNMDALEAIGRMQILQNARLIENYQMVKGQFIFQHYFDKGDYDDQVSALVQEFEVPAHLRHYDIISQVINTLSGEWQKRPDIFTVKGIDDITKSEYVREKTDMLSQYVMGKIQEGILKKLVQKGIDPNRTNFESEEEQTQYQEEIQKQIQELTPPEIEKYMNISWKSIAEIWAENQMQIDKYRFNQPEMDKVEFEDYLTSDECYRHFFITGNINGYGVETWNPVTTFKHKSPEVKEVENGNLVGRILYMSPSDVINRYGYKMKADDIKDLDKDGSFNKSGNGPNVDMLYDTTRVPFKDYRDYTNVVNAFGIDPNLPIAQANMDLFGTIYDDTGLYTARGLVQVTEAYWKSQRKVGKCTVLDEVSGQPHSFYVDETFDATGFVEIEGDDWDQNQINTIVWTWVNQVWKGIKINAKNTRLSKDVYIDLGPNEVQFRSEQNLYGAKLPVCGQIFNNRNAQSMSLVDLMKPHQIGYNVAMNQLYQIMQREIGKFLIMDVNMLPLLKDWGEKNYEKFMLVAKELGIAPADTSPTNNPNMRGVAQSGQLPKEVDFDESARMINRGKLAEFFEARALAQVGITPQRLGSIAASETATGVQEAVNRSYAQTESYFTNFSNYKRRCLQMNLEIAQHVHSKNKDISQSVVQSDFSRAFIDLNGEDLLLRDLQVYVSNSQEDKRILETARTLFIQNNTTDADPIDLFTVLEANSPAKIKEQLKVAYQRKQQEVQAQREHEQQLAQMQIDAQKEATQEQQAFEHSEKELDRQNKIDLAVIQSVGNEGSYSQTEDKTGEVIEQARLIHDRTALESDIALKNQELGNKQLDSVRKSQIEKEKLKLQKQLQANEIAMKKSEMKNKIKIEESKLEQVQEQNQNQILLSDKKHKSDMALKNKDLEIKNKELEHAKSLQKIKLDGEKAQLEVDKKKAEHDLETKKKLNDIKVKNAKKPKK